MERYRSVGDTSVAGEDFCRTHQDRVGRVFRGETKECDSTVFGPFAAAEGWNI